MSLFLLGSCGKTEEEERVDKMISLLESTDFFDEFNEENLEIIEVTDCYLPASCTDDYYKKFNKIINLVKNPSSSGGEVFDAYFDFEDYSSLSSEDYYGICWKVCYNGGDYVEIFTDEDVSEIISYNEKAGIIHSYLNKIRGLEGICIHAQLEGSITGTENNGNLSESERAETIEKLEESMRDVDNVLRYRLKNDLQEIFFSSGDTTNVVLL